MDQIGEELRLRRESKGLSLREVEDATKIRMKYLIALEANDFEALPGKVYVIGFLRTYARFLEMNDEELVNRVKSLSYIANDDDDELVEKTRIATRKSSLFIIVVIILALITAGIGFALLHDRDDTPPNNVITETQTPQEEEKQEEQEPPNNLPAAPETEEPAGSISESEINGVSVTVIVKEDTCWMDVKIDGKNDFSGTLKAGENRTFVGQENITVKYGNAKAVEVIHNGKSTFPVDPTRQVVTKEYLEENTP
ncbi:MAG: helix-turn-helix domain-containing protein [Bacillota bacterium]|jgi:cytoskeleton protein RodZ